MKKIIISFFIIIFNALLLCSCTQDTSTLTSAVDSPIKTIGASTSTFNITFIDVGQGDAALIECDGHYMLIDGGDTSAGDKMYNVMVENNIKKLDILALSHLHADHIGGLIKALSYASSIDLTISNSDYSNTETFIKFERQLRINESSITVPHAGEKYALGSAEVEVIDNASSSENDSLVLLVTYKNTTFLFTGDIEENQQDNITSMFENGNDAEKKITLMKMPHHGSYSRSLYRFVRTFMPDYTIISCGQGNIYGHPHKETMDLLDSKTYKPQVYRTDMNGDIIVSSDGKRLDIKTSK